MQTVYTVCLVHRNTDEQFNVAAKDAEEAVAKAKAFWKKGAVLASVEPKYDLDIP